MTAMHPNRDLLVLTLLLIACPARAAHSPRLDVEVPKSETCLIKLGKGPTMRVPWQVIDCDDSMTSVPAPVEQFELTVAFPQMKLGKWTSGVSRIWAQVEGRDVHHVDKFPVKIVYVFYPEQFKDPTSWAGPNPQVWQMKANFVRLSRGQRRDQNFEPYIVKSKVKDLRMMLYDYPPWPLDPSDPAPGRMVEPANANYELMMTCLQPIECTGFVQLKPSLVQYRFLIPAEAVNHTAEAIASINRMIELWIAQAN